MTQVFGDFIEQLEEPEEYLTIAFSPSSLPLKKRWENNGISADFIAEYFKNFFVSRQEQAGEVEDQIAVENLCNAVKYIANELLENAMKFQDETASFSAKIIFSLASEKLIFYVENGININQVASFQTFIQKMLDEDPEKLYLESMRNNAKGDTDTPSRLGLLSMICDYSAKLGWKFQPHPNNPLIMTVSTTVCLPL